MLDRRHRRERARHRAAPTRHEPNRRPVTRMVDGCRRRRRPARRAARSLGLRARSFGRHAARAGDRDALPGPRRVPGADHSAGDLALRIAIRRGDHRRRPHRARGRFRARRAGRGHRDHRRRLRRAVPAASAWFQDIPADAAERIRSASLPPTTIIAGDADLLTGVRPVADYAAALGADLVWLAACGHYPWVEQPTAFRDAITTWLGRD